MGQSKLSYKYNSVQCSVEYSFYAVCSTVYHSVVQCVVQCSINLVYWGVECVVQ